MIRGRVVKAAGDVTEFVGALVVVAAGVMLMLLLLLLLTVVGGAVVALVVGSGVTTTVTMVVVCGWVLAVLKTSPTLAWLMTMKPGPPSWPLIPPTPTPAG